MLYDIDEEIIKELPTTRLQSPKGISSLDETSSIINNSITSSNENVKPTDYSMQNQENNTIANNQNSVYNNIALGEVKNIPIEDVLPLKAEGGYRNEQQMSKLREDIKKNGITNPIELVRNSDGSIEIENGNHRLQIANELGLKEVPIKFVDSWEKVGRNIDVSESEFAKRWENYDDRNNSNGGQTDRINEESSIFNGNSTTNRNEFKNRRATEGNDSLSGEIQRYNDRTSGNTAFEENAFQGGEEKTRKEAVKDSNESSFSVNNKNQNFPINENMKQRKHYKSIIESPYTSKEAKSIAKELIISYQSLKGNNNCWKIHPL